MSTPHNTSRLTPPPNLKTRQRALDDPSVQAFIEGEAPSPVKSSDSGHPAAVQPTQAATISAPLAPPPAKLPWEGMSDSYLKQKPFRMLENEAEMLNFLGETTYGETSQSIFTIAIRNEMVKRFTERGFNVTQDPNTGKLTITAPPAPSIK